MRERTRHPNRLTIRWSDDGSTFSVCESDGRALLFGCVPAVRLSEPDSRHAGWTRTQVVHRGRGTCGRHVLVETTDLGTELRLALDVQRASSGALLLTLQVTNGGDRPVAIDSITPLHCAPAAAHPADVEHDAELLGARSLRGWSVWIHGRQMNSEALTHRFGSGEQHASFPGQLGTSAPDRSDWSSHMMALFDRCRPAASLLLGFVSQGRQFTEIRWKTRDGEQQLDAIVALCGLEGYVLAPGEAVTSETLMIALGDDPYALAEEYARVTARTMKARAPQKVPAACSTGWCSWYFYNQVSEADTLANLEALGTLPYCVEYVQIDDGFQSATRDWLTTNERFPQGMKPLAAAIAAAGYRPGLWLAPFTLHRDARVLDEHPEWALRDADGNIIFQEIWLGPCAGLDCTHPGAQEWLRHVIRTVVHDWGYRFLKLDALFTACHPRARHYAANTTTAANLHRGLEIIRAAAGDETFILGCTCPFGPAIGLVDAMRVGPDVEAVWFSGLHPSVKHAMRLALQRTWMHRRFWLNDPDCLNVRDYQSPHVPGALTVEEARFLATGVALGGGLAVLSNDLASLGPERREIALRVLPPTGRAARPVDLPARETPSVWTLRLGRGRRAVAVLNWDDEPRDAAVTWPQLGLSGPHYAREQWTGEDLGRLDGLLDLRAIPPHGCRVVLLDPARPPRRSRRLLPVRR